MDKEKIIYRWKGRDIETLNPEETRDVLRQVLEDLARERKMHLDDIKMMQIFNREIK